jgi:hypothetical protein
VAIVATVCAAGPAVAAGVDFRFGAARYEGEFGGDETTILEQAPFELVLSGRGSITTISLPYERIDRTGNVTFTADGPVILGVGGPGRPTWQTSPAGERESGRGDLLLRYESFLVRAGKGKRPALSYVVDAKLPTADDKKGLGTGRRDWGFGLSYLQPLGKHWQILGDATYRLMGDPEFVDFQDRLMLAAGFAIVAQRVIYRARFENSPPVLARVPVFNALGIPIGTEDVEDRRTVRLDATVLSVLGGSTRIGVTKGLNDSSEDLGFVVMLSTSR